MWFWISPALDHAMSLTLTGLFAIQTKIFVSMHPNINCVKLIVIMSCDVW